VVVLESKPSADGKAWIVRLFGASGENRRARLSWDEKDAPKVWHSDLSEQPLAPAGDDVDVAAWELVTLRVERSQA
jgi:hypothetical protein